MGSASVKKKFVFGRHRKRTGEREMEIKSGNDGGKRVREREIDDRAKHVVSV